jgi:hypothetical protein
MVSSVRAVSARRARLVYARAFGLERNTPVCGKRCGLRAPNQHWSAGRGWQCERTSPLSVEWHPVMFPSLPPGATHRLERTEQPVIRLDFGGPAVMEPVLFRPETLRRHLSVGLPCRETAHILAPVLIGRCDVTHTSPTYELGYFLDLILRFRVSPRGCEQLDHSGFCALNVVFFGQFL